MSSSSATGTILGNRKVRWTPHRSSTGRLVLAPEEVVAPEEACEFEEFSFPRRERILKVKLPGSKGGQSAAFTVHDALVAVAQTLLVLAGVRETAAKSPSENVLDPAFVKPLRFIITGSWVRAVLERERTQSSRLPWSDVDVMVARRFVSDKEVAQGEKGFDFEHASGTGRLDGTAGCTVSTHYEWSTEPERTGFHSKPLNIVRLNRVN